MKRLVNIILIVGLVNLALDSAKATQKLFLSDIKKEYFIEPANEYTWQEAFEECKNINMELLTIETLEKSNEIRDLLTKTFSGKKIPKMYIGANDLKEFRKFSWLLHAEQQPFTYTNWEKNEPNNYKNLNERCVNIGFHGTVQWNDINCDRKYGFICQQIDYDKLIALGALKA